MKEYKIRFATTTDKVFANNAYEARLKFLKANNMKPSQLQQLEVNEL